MRTAALPWGPWSEPEIVFDPVADGGLCSGATAGLLHSMTRPWTDLVPGLACTADVNTPEHLPPTPESHWREDPGSPYGPYVLTPYTRLDGDTVTLLFLLSTWNPYQVLLMETRIRPRS